MNSKQLIFNDRKLYIAFSVKEFKGNQINPPETDLYIDYIEDAETGYDVTEELEDNQELRNRVLGGL